MISGHDLDAIWMDVDPEAQEAFERLAVDHGRRFAENAKDYILSCKLLDMNKAAIRAGLPWGQTSLSDTVIKFGE